MANILEHLHFIARAEVLNPPKEIPLIEQWMRDMVKSIGMKELAPPRAVYSDMIGNRGMTCDVLLNTSNACLHSWDECDPGLIMLDVFTCGKLDINIIFDKLTIFKPTKIEYLYLDRNKGLKILDMKEMNFG